MKLIAITGSIGCGKTTLANIIRELGYVVYDVDVWVKNIYRNKNFLCELEKLFPESVVDGVANKRYLRNIVFNDKNKLKDLEFIIYPFLMNKIKKMINNNSKSNHKVFLDAALLFEKGWDKYCDFVILADVDYEIQKERVMKRDNVTADDFDKINNVQLKNEDKKLLSDVVINTDKKINKLKVELIKIIENLE